MADKKSIKDFVADLRSEYDVPDNISDDQLLKRYFNKHPEEMEKVETSEPRRPMGGQPQAQPNQDGFMKRLMGGVVAAPIEGISSAIRDGFDQAREFKDEYKTKGLGHVLNPFNDHSPDHRLGKPGPGLGDMARGVLDTKGIAQDMDNDNMAGAFGRATTVALGLASMGKAGLPAKAATASELDEMLNLGRNSLKEEGAMNAAKLLTKEHAAVLDGNIAGIDTALDKQLANVQALRKSIAKPLRTVSKLERAPNAQVKDIAAAKDVLSRIATRTQKGMLPWKDLREMYKEVGNAAEQMRGSSELKTSLMQIKQQMLDELKAGAKAGGQEKEFNTWVKDYADLKSLQRSYVRVVKGQTASQLEAGATTGKPMTVPGTRGTLSVGGKKALKAARKEIGDWHKASTELKGRISAKQPSPSAVQATPGTPGGGQPPSPTTPPATPPAAGGGGVRPPQVGGQGGPGPGGSFPPVSGGSQGATPAPMPRILPPAPPEQSITGAAKPPMARPNPGGDWASIIKDLTNLGGQ